jgi:hypothetical protein
VSGVGSCNNNLERVVIQFTEKKIRVLLCSQRNIHLSRCLVWLVAQETLILARHLACFAPVLSQTSAFTIANMFSIMNYIPQENEIQKDEFPLKINTCKSLISSSVSERSMDR